MTDPDPNQPATGSVYGQPPSGSPGTPWAGTESTGSGAIYGHAAGSGAPGGPGAAAPVDGGTGVPGADVPSAGVPSAGPSAPAWTPPAQAAPTWPPAPSSPAGYGAYDAGLGTSAPPAGYPAPAPVAAPPANFEPKAKRGGAFTTGVALLALLLGLIGVVLGVYAVGVARDAKTTATGGTGSGATTQPQPPPGGHTGTTGPTNPTGPTDTGAPTSTSTAGDLNPQADFTLAYPEAQTLVVHPTSNCGTNQIDLDVPAVNVGDGGDLELHSCGDGTETWQVSDGVQLATADTGDLTAKDCANLIRTSALPTVDVPVSTPHLVMCMTTSFTDARNKGISWKISLIKQTPPTQDGTVSITVTSWVIPQ